MVAFSDLMLQLRRHRNIYLEKSLKIEVAYLERCYLRQRYLMRDRRTHRFPVLPWCRPTVK